MDKKLPDKCDNCGSTHSKTFWDFKDGSILCDSCHHKIGLQWENKVKSKKLLSAAVVIIFVIIIIGALFLLMSPNQNSLETTNKSNQESQPPAATQVINECYNCPATSDWSSCINGTQTRTVLQCGESTGFRCIQQTETQQCGPPKPPIQQATDSNPTVSNALTNAQLTYLQQLTCSKIEPTFSGVRNTAVSIASASPGNWNINQLADLYIWMKNNISYVNDPIHQEYFASASETLNDKAGDCEDQAILVSSLIQSVGGTSKVVLAPSCGHAFASVFISTKKEDFDAAQKTIADIYWQKGIYDLSNQNLFGYSDNSGYWLIVDPAGGYYLGDTYVGCRNVTSFYPIDCTNISAQNNESRTDYVPQGSTSVPNLKVNISQCEPSINILQGLGEVTDVYVTVTNSGSADAHNVAVIAHASDEDKQYKNTANWSIIKAGQTASVKLTLDTQQNVPTLVTLNVTSTEGAGAEIQKDCS
ncbi:MAG: transglutaminase-like domain-containing protein [archaeon]